MKRFTFLFAMVFVWALAISAQTKPPRWIKHLPKPSKHGNYYYRVTSAEGRTYQEAYTKAFNTAIYESYSKISGISTNINGTQESNNEVHDVITTDPSQVKLPINKVCEYEERVITTGRKKLYVLWQVANSALEDPKFDDYDKCD